MTDKHRHRLWRNRKPRCKICDKLYFARGLCHTHYQAQRRYGDPFVPEKARQLKYDLMDKINELIIETDAKIKKLRTRIK